MNSKHKSQAWYRKISELKKYRKKKVMGLSMDYNSTQNDYQNDQNGDYKLE